MLNEWLTVRSEVQLPADPEVPSWKGDDFQVPVRFLRLVAATAYFVLGPGVLGVSKPQAG